MKNLEEVIREYREKRITLKEMADEAIEAVFKNPCYFKLDRMHEDERSDFIMYVYTKMNQIIETYNPNISSFRTYLANFINSMLRSWLRIYFRKQAHEKAIEEYAITEYAVTVSDAEPEYEIEEHEHKQTPLPDNVKRYLRSCMKRIPDSTKIMMLALKSEHFINSSHIKKLQKATGIPEEKILDMFLRLQGPLYKKKLLFNHHRELQNKSYILKKRSSLLLESTGDNSYMREQLKKSKEFHNDSWKRYTDKLRRLKIIIPSNLEIAKILGISSDQIRRLQKFVTDSKEKT